MRDIEQEVIERVERELSPLDVEAAYREMLDDCYDPFMGTYAPSQCFEGVDPTAYRCGLNDYQDSLSRDGQYEEINEELYDAREVQEIRDEIQGEIDAEEAEDDEDDED